MKKYYLCFKPLEGSEYGDRDCVHTVVTFDCELAWNGNRHITDWFNVGMYRWLHTEDGKCRTGGYPLEMMPVDEMLRCVQCDPSESEEFNAIMAALGIHNVQFIKDGWVKSDDTQWDVDPEPALVAAEEERERRHKARRHYVKEESRLNARLERRWTAAHQGECALQPRLRAKRLRAVLTEISYAEYVIENIPYVTESDAFSAHRERCKLAAQKMLEEVVAYCATAGVVA